jgi:hypothetical protein
VDPEEHSLNSTPATDVATTIIFTISTEMATSLAVTLATMLVQVYSATLFISSKPMLKDVQDRIFQEKGLIIKERPVLVDPEDSEMLATPYPRANHRMGLSSITTSTSPDLVAL